MHKCIPAAQQQQCIMHCCCCAVYTVLCSCCVAGLCTGAAGVVHRCTRLQRLCTRGCVHTTSVHTTSVHTTLDHCAHCIGSTCSVICCCCGYLDCAQPGLLTVTHSDISVHTSCSHNVAPRCTLCAPIRMSVCEQIWLKHR